MLRLSSISLAQLFLAREAGLFFFAFLGKSVHRMFSGRSLVAMLPLSLQARLRTYPSESNTVRMAV